MEQSVSGQLAQAAAAVIMGAELGLVYDVAKAVRLALHSRWLRGLIDCLYCAAAALILFYFGLGPGEGQLRIFMLLSALLGGAAYGFFLSPVALPPLCSLVSAVKKLLRPVKKWAKRVGSKKIFSKYIFPKNQIWFTIKNRYGRGQTDSGKDREKEGLSHEAEKGKYIYQGRDSGAGALRRGQHRHRPVGGGGD